MQQNYMTTLDTHEVVEESCQGNVGQHKSETSKKNTEKHDENGKMV